MVGPTSSRRDFIRSVASAGNTLYSGTPSTAMSSSSGNIVVFSGDDITPREWIEIKALPCRKQYENDTSSVPQWLLEPGPVRYPPNRAQRRAARKNKRG